MEYLFVPYDLALKLKKLGFNETCLAHYNNIFPDGITRLNLGVTNKGTLIQNYTKEGDIVISNDYVLAPLWQQVFDWFRINHEAVAIISTSHRTLNNWDDSKPLYEVVYVHSLMIRGLVDKYKLVIYKSYEEAREGCLVKLIELCKKGYFINE